VLPVPLKLFPCQAFRSLGLLGVGGLLLSPRWRLCSCPIASLLEDIAPFLLSGLSAGCASRLGLGCCPSLPRHSGDHLLSFGSGVAPAGSWLRSWLLGCLGGGRRCCVSRARLF